MITRRFTVLFVVLAVLAGCTTAAQRRQRYVEANPELKPEIAAAIIEGRIVEGMTADDVRASWGEPELRSVSITEAGEQDIWSYRAPIAQFQEGKVILTFTNGRLVKLIN